MSPDPPVARREVELTNSYGLHLGPASKFVKLAIRFQAEITVFHNGKTINGKSVLDLTTLAADCGSRLQIEARGKDADRALEALITLVASEFRDPDEAKQKDPAS